MNSSFNKKIVAITAGDPEGIGPEIIEKSLEKLNPDCPVLVVGKREYFKKDLFNKVTCPEDIEKNGLYILEPEISEEDPSFSFVKEATGFALEGKISGIVTAPINKEKWIRSGNLYMGHTDYFIKTTGVKEWSMFFWSGDIKTALYTTHIPLKDVFSRLNTEDLVRFCRFVHSELKRLTKKDFTVFVSGLNPHAGEGGNIGMEEIEIISPAVELLKKEFVISGPHPPDTVFLKARSIPDSVVISLYHDQGLIAFKLLKVNSGVNVTLGLPFVRTSPDHGTAYDISGKGIADPGSMIESIKLAIKFASLT